MVWLAIPSSYDRAPMIIDHFVLILEVLQESFALLQTISGRENLDILTLLFHSFSQHLIWQAYLHYITCDLN